MSSRREQLDADYCQVRWLRLYRPGPWRSAVLLLAAIGCVLIATSASVIISSGRSLGERLVLILVGIALAATAFALTSRGLAGGVWVRDAGVRISLIRRTMTLDWNDVAAVERRSGQVPVLGLPWRLMGEEVLLVTADQRAIRTGLASASLDFFGRPEAYDMAATALVDWWEAHRS